jgi:hypothetical protein
MEGKMAEYQEKAGRKPRGKMPNEMPMRKSRERKTEQPGRPGSPFKWQERKW